MWKTCLSRSTSLSPLRPSRYGTKTDRYDILYVSVVLVLFPCTRRRHQAVQDELDNVKLRSHHLLLCQGDELAQSVISLSLLAGGLGKLYEELQKAADKFSEPVKVSQSSHRKRLSYTLSILIVAHNALVHLLHVSTLMVLSFIAFLLVINLYYLMINFKAVINLV